MSPALRTALADLEKSGRISYVEFVEIHISEAKRND